jgi:hypothetical protein
MFSNSGGRAMDLRWQNSQAQEQNIPVAPEMWLWFHPLMARYLVEDRQMHKHTLGCERFDFLDSGRS